MRITLCAHWHFASGYLEGSMEKPFVTVVTKDGKHVCINREHIESIEQFGMKTSAASSVYCRVTLSQVQFDFEGQLSEVVNLLKMQDLTKG